MSKRGQKNKRRIDTKLLMWGGLCSLFIMILLYLMWHFTVLGKESINKRLQKTFQQELDEDVMEFTYSLQVMTASGQAIADVLGAEEVKGDRWTRAARGLCQETDAYAVLIVDDKGEGVDNHGKNISLKELDYFRLSDKQGYIYVENDYITSSPAIISMIPMKRDREIVGMIYLYYAPGEVESKVKLKAGKRSEVFCLIDDKGNYMAFVGRDEYFSPEGNFYETLCSTVSGNQKVPSENLARRIRNSLLRFCQTVDAGGTEKVITGKPLQIRNWYLIHIVNEEYLDALVAGEWRIMRSLIMEIIIVIFAFLGLVILMNIFIYFANKKKRIELKDEAETDLLTGLSNKIATEKKIQQYIEENPDKSGMFIIFDIDNFKKINDTKGHAFGDEVLKALGERILCEFRYSDILGRTGGDEFIIFLKGIREGQQLEAQKKRLNHFFEDFSVGSYVKYSPTASVGVSLYPRDGKSYQALYEAGDKALYEAKRNGKNQLVVYEQHMMGPNPTEFKGRE